LSRFKHLLVEGIIEDMIMKMEANNPVSALPALTFPDDDMMLPDFTEGDIEDTFK